jgi:hypothetical protein
MKYLDYLYNIFNIIFIESRFLIAFFIESLLTIFIPGIHSGEQNFLQFGFPFRYLYITGLVKDQIFSTFVIELIPLIFNYLLIYLVFEVFHRLHKFLIKNRSL